jgi:hypothetical protein
MRVSTHLLATLLVLALPLAASADKDTAAALFNGTNLDGWKIKGDNTDRSKWTVGAATMDAENNRALKVAKAEPGKGELINAAGGGVDIYSEAEFGDCLVTLELMVPKGSNSGVYLMGNYEVQVLDSFGKDKVGPGDIGGIYGAAAPRSNAARAPGEWQTFEIDFQAPRFENGKKTANARFLCVKLNGQVIHEDVEVKGVTGGNLGRGETAKGPLLFQGDHGPVAYRNIRVKAK